MGDSDADLIARSCHDPRAFAMIFARHYDAMHRFLWTRIGDAAEDHVHQRNFRVHAFADDGDTCVEVEMSRGTNEHCRPLERGLALQTLSVDGEVTRVTL
ncbi:MAG: hypothetical protein WD638_05180 [Nitriliruptoraceae bacterium]